MSAREDRAGTTQPVYLFWNGEMMLNGPREKAWPRVIDYPSWQNYSTVEHVSGPRGHEGEVVLLRKEEHGFQFPPYYARTIRLEPEHRVVWKTWPVPGTQEMDFFGIVEFVLLEQGNQTKFCYNTVYEFLVPFSDQEEIETFRRQQYENFGALFASILPKLSSLVEAASKER